MFEIDTAWQDEEPLKNICTFLRRGKSPIYAEQKEGPIIINQDCIRWDSIDLSKVKYHSADVSKIKAEFYLQAQDILINSTGTGTIGRINQWTSNEEAVADSHVTIARIDKNKAESKYIRYFLSSEPGQRYLESFCYTGSTNQIELSGRYLRRLRVPLPEPKEQKAIVTVLSKVDETIAAVENSIKAAERLKKSLMQNLLTGKLKPDGTWRSEDEFYIDEKFGKIPIGWEIKKGIQLTEKITKGQSPKWQGFEYQQSGILFITSENVLNGKLEISSPKYLPIEFNNKIKNSQLKKGDILINIVGASIARSCIFEDENEIANINQAICLFRPKSYYDTRSSSF